MVFEEDTQQQHNEELKQLQKQRENEQFSMRKIQKNRSSITKCLNNPPLLKKKLI